MLCYSFQIIFLSSRYLVSLSSLQSSVRYYPYCRLNIRIIMPAFIQGQIVNQKPVKQCHNFVSPVGLSQNTCVLILIHRCYWSEGGLWNSSMFLILRVNLYFSQGHSTHDSPFIWRNQSLEYFNYCLGDQLFYLSSVSNVSLQLSKLDGKMR